LPGTPRTDPGVRNSRTGLLPWVFDGKATLRPWVKDFRWRQPVIAYLMHAFPVHAIFLTSSSQRAAPELQNIVTEGL
jgi:hypothetical protein